MIWNKNLTQQKSHYSSYTSSTQMSWASSCAPPCSACWSSLVSATSKRAKPRFRHSGQKIQKTQQEVLLNQRRKNSNKPRTHNWIGMVLEEVEQGDFFSHWFLLCFSKTMSSRTAWNKSKYTNKNLQMYLHNSITFFKIYSDVISRSF